MHIYIHTNTLTSPVWEYVNSLVNLITEYKIYKTK